MFVNNISLNSDILYIYVYIYTLFFSLTQAEAEIFKGNLLIHIIYYLLYVIYMLIF